MSVPELNRRAPGFLLVAQILNIIVLLSSILILVLLSVEILKGPNVMPRQLYLNIQLIICIILMVDYWYLFFLAPRKWRYFKNYLILLLVAIPYYNIVYWFDLSLTPLQSVLLRAIVLIRGGYGLIVMINWFTKSKVTNMMITYLIMLVAMAYFGSLVFYSIEKGLNPGLHSFSDAIWWACMDVTTVGCSIEPVTNEGRILAVVLAVMGMSMFPILTVYITNYFQSHMAARNAEAAAASTQAKQ